MGQQKNANAEARHSVATVRNCLVGLARLNPAMVCSFLFFKTSETSLEEGILDAAVATMMRT